MKIAWTFAALLAALMLSPSATGHGGGLDRNGCHTNRKTGVYHCHGGSSPSPAPQSPAPIRRATASTVLTTQASATTKDRDLVRAAQVLLHALGYQPSLLGSLDERTRAAVRAFQRAERVDTDGVINEYLVLRLAEKVAARCP